MTRSEIQDLLQRIYESRGDWEAAHGLEDQLRHDVLTAIAKESLDGITPEQACELALTSMQFDFPRYCA